MNKLLPSAFFLDPIWHVLSNIHSILQHHNRVHISLFQTVWKEPKIPLGGESEQKTKGRRKRRALVGLWVVGVTRSSANQTGVWERENRVNGSDLRCELRGRESKQKLSREEGRWRTEAERWKGVGRPNRSKNKKKTWLRKQMSGERQGNTNSGSQGNQERPRGELISSLKQMCECICMISILPETEMALTPVLTASNFFSLLDCLEKRETYKN